MDRGQLNRWLYRGGRPGAIARIINALTARATATGRMPAPLATLEVVGRRSGRLVRLPVVVTDVDGRHYLVSMLGEGVGWVRNVRAAGHHATLVRVQRTEVLLEEVPAAERAPVLKRYCEVATSGRDHIPVAPDAPLTEFERVAGDYPVFRIVALPRPLH